MTNIVTASMVRHVMMDEKVLDVSAEMAKALVKDVKTDIEVLAVLENLRNLCFGLLKENGVTFYEDI